MSQSRVRVGEGASLYSDTAGTPTPRLGPRPARDRHHTARHAALGCVLVRQMPLVGYSLSSLLLRWRPERGESKEATKGHGQLGPP